MTLPATPDPEHIAAIVRRCALVVGLHPGRFGEAATYLPHRRVTGVQLRPGEVGVHVTARYPASITEVDAQVRAALAEHLAGLPLTVTIEDYAASDARSDASPPGGTTDPTPNNPAGPTGTSAPLKENP